MGISFANDLILRAVDTIDVFEVGTGDYMFSLGELSDYSIEQSEESKPIYGRNGRIISRIKKNKGVTIKGTSGVVSSGLLAIQTGGIYQHGTKEILWADYLKVRSNSANTNFYAVGTIGAEIISVAVKSMSGETVRLLRQGASVSSETFVYSPSNKELKFLEIDDGTDIVVYYKRFINTTTLINNANRHSGRAMLYVNGLAEDRCFNVYRVQFFFPKVDFDGEFSLSINGEQTIHRFEAVALAETCFGDAMYYSYNIFDVDADDVEMPGLYVYIGNDNTYYIGNDDTVYTYEVL